MRSECAAVKTISALCAVVLLCAALGIRTFATPVQHEGALQRITTNGEFLFNMEGMVPGDSVKSVAVLENITSGVVTFYLKAQPAEQKEQANRLLDILELEVTMRSVDAAGSISDQVRMVYDGAASGGSWNSYVNLGNYGAGERAVLEVTLRVPTSVGNAYKDTLASMDWLFYCSVNGGTIDPGGEISEPEDEDSGGNGSGSVNNGNNGGGSEGVRDSAGALTTFFEDPVPLATVTILDGNVPLANLPRTGTTGIDIRTIWGILLASTTLLALLFLDMKQKP